MITKQSIETLKTHLDIVDVISSFLPLKKAGANFKACCPFHGEETPSFVVSPAKQIYHCFGCGVGGDSVKFVMELEKLSYVEALEKLAFMNNFTLEYEQNSEKKKLDTKIMDEINAFFKKQLEAYPNMREYLSKRGIFESSIEKFEIGYAPQSHTTINFLKNNYLSINDAKEYGVVEQSQNGMYCRFSERITFPIYSMNGKLVGFGGRTLADNLAKYINSPQTPLFNKSKLLYGYNLAKDAIYKKNQIIVTEGYVDVIMLHQAGFTNAVATLGTALTSDHLPLLKRGEPKIIVAYDGDKAGMNAAFKASSLLAHNNMAGGVVIFEGGMDPADMVQNNQIQALDELFQKPISFVEFVIRKIVQDHDLSDPQEKKKGFDEALEFLKTLNPLIADEYRTFVATSFGIQSKYITINQKMAKPKEKIALSVFDLGELQIIKTLMEMPPLLEYVLEVIDSEMFEYHRLEFEAIKSGDFNHPKLLDIILKDEIKCYDEKELKNQLGIFLVNYYHKKLMFISSNSQIQYKKKVMLVHSIREIIKKLKQGALIAYDRELIGTI